jgi:DNA-binding CsgD family transcriptional regulator
MKSVEFKLSKRETEVCDLLMIGSNTTDIAKILNLKSNTVSTVKKSIFKKTNTINLIELYELYKQA